MENIGRVLVAIPVDDIKQLDLTDYDAVSGVGVPTEGMSKDQVSAHVDEQGKWGRELWVISCVQKAILWVCLSA